jgi:hypothetical protein
MRSHTAIPVATIRPRCAHCSIRQTRSLDAADTALMRSLNEILRPGDKCNSTASLSIEATADGRATGQAQL